MCLSCTSTQGPRPPLTVYPHTSFYTEEGADATMWGRAGRPRRERNSEGSMAQSLAVCQRPPSCHVWAL